MKTIWRKKKIIGAGAICLTLVGGCTARAPHVPSGAAATARQAQTVGQQAEAALPQAATARAEPSGQRVEAGMNQFASRASETLSEREVRRFKKISTHEHFRTGGDIKPYLAAMKRANIEKAVFVPTAWPPSNPQSKENLQELLALQRQYPKKIIVFATAYNKDPKAAMLLEEALKSGAQGIKFIDWLASAKYPDAAGPALSEKTAMLAPIQVDSLTLTPIVATAEPGKDEELLLVLDEAMASGKVKIQEVAEGSVNSLTFVNQADHPVFVLAGEVIIGGKQDRIIGRNTLIPAKTTQAVPVYCVEHGRWQGNSTVFTSGHALASKRDDTCP